MSGQHAVYAPSSAPEYGYCSGSVLANQAVPDRETQETREGNAAHWVVAECLSVWRYGGTSLAGDYLGRTAPNGIVITEEIVDSAAVMVGDVLDVCQQYGGLQNILIEHRVHMPRIHPTKCWGTLDVGLDLRHIGLIFLWDFKHGHGQVDAKGNFQPIEYVEGLREEWKIDEQQAQNITVHIRMVQPRCDRQSGPVEEWVVKLCDLRGDVEHLAAQCHEAETNPQMVAGKHCRYCPARGPHCVASRQAGYMWVDYAKAPYQIETMGSPDLATERQLLEEGLVFLKARFGAIEDELEHRLSQGATDTGLTLEAGKGRQNWTVPVEQAVAFGQQFGVDLAKPGAVTPTQAALKVTAEMRPFFKQALKAVTARKSSGLKLVQASDSRTARAFTRRK